MIASASAAPAEAPPVVKPDCSLLLAGDSIITGTTVLQHKPADRIREWRPAYTVTLIAVAGQSITESIGLFQNTQITQRFVSIEWGVNDITKNYAFEAPLRAAVAHVKASGKTPVMTGLYQTVKSPIPRKVATDEGLAYADWDSMTGELQSDMHPTQDYSDALTRRFVDVLDKLAPECMR